MRRYHAEAASQLLRALDEETSCPSSDVTVSWRTTHAFLARACEEALLADAGCFELFSGRLAAACSTARMLHGETIPPRVRHALLPDRRPGTRERALRVLGTGFLRARCAISYVRRVGARKTSTRTGASS